MQWRNHRKTNSNRNATRKRYKVVATPSMCLLLVGSILGIEVSRKNSLSPSPSLFVSLSHGG